VYVASSRPRRAAARWAASAQSPPLGVLSRVNRECKRSIVDVRTPSLPVSHRCGARAPGQAVGWYMLIVEGSGAVPSATTAGES